MRELPHVFNRSRITVDVTNQLAQNSVPANSWSASQPGGSCWWIAGLI